jgi:serine/threonine protein phosphatase PrpC
MKLDLWGSTDVGRVRRNNEDRWFVDAGLGLAIVADGMGGAACGEVASSLCIETIEAYFRQPAPDDQVPEGSIKQAIRLANQRVLAAAQDMSGCQGMGSTVVAGLWSPPRLMIANVGDSRAYLWRGGALSQLTTDQTIAAELRDKLGFDEEQVAGFSNRNVLTMAIGHTEDILIMTREERLAAGDEILLCSDGLWGPVSGNQIASIMAPSRSLAEKGDLLLRSALDAGGPDNVTVVLLRVHSNEDAA